MLQRESSSDEEKEEEDAFEREMDSEVVGMLEQLTSPTALRVLLSKEGRKLGTKCKGTTPVPVAASAVLGKSPSTGKESSTDKHYSGTVRSYPVKMYTYGKGRQHFQRS